MDDELASYLCDIAHEYGRAMPLSDREGAWLRRRAKQIGKRLSKTPKDVIRKLAPEAFDYLDKLN